MNSIKAAHLDHPIAELIADRWSPCAFSDRDVPSEVLQSLFEAARWAASSYNEQPWRYMVATLANPFDYDRLLSCLVEGNQGWAKTAPVLALGCIAENFTQNGKPNAAAEHDLGAASTSLALEATARGLAIHQMIGIQADRARELFQIPDGFTPLTALAIGYPGDPESLPEKIRQRDLASRSRNPLKEFVYGLEWGKAAALLD